VQRLQELGFAAQAGMKILTLNFVTCARKACKPVATSFPLHPQDCELEVVETDLNVAFLQNILPRLDWPALTTMTAELGLTVPSAEIPEREDLVIKATGEAKAGDTQMEIDGDQEKKQAGEDEALEPSELAQTLHTLLLETTIQSGKLVCANCGHEYAIKEGIANFLLPSHLV
jgi:multifunctional methyltransferase subunit TRM112